MHLSQVTIYQMPCMVYEIAVATFEQFATVELQMNPNLINGDWFTGHVSRTMRTHIDSFIRVQGAEVMLEYKFVLGQVLRVAERAHVSFVDGHKLGYLLVVGFFGQ
uniref:Uncharacterized protein n=1 Tax=Cacopsylla melanoneura TaxID=428564 RepID=A0A8D9F079_9HEMI